MISSPQTYTEGTFILFDKPLGWTSHDVVNRVRYHLTRYCGVKKLKVGHGGTLDPKATGLLVVATGPNTKKLQYLIDADKEYTGTIKLGAVTASYDGETAEEQRKPWEHITREDVLRVLEKFTGVQQQVPPIHSAIKQDGRPVYLAARAGETPEMKSRSINISELELTDFEPPYVHLRVACSKGTYIRSLAHDIGQELGCGAWLSGLRRTRIGSFLAENSLDTEAFIATLQELRNKPKT